MHNNHRFDLSDYLLHFFRDVDQSGDKAIVFPQNMGWHSLDEDDALLPAGYLLRAALRNGRLWATWSKRGPARTIFGPNPAVCFTEMPIAALLEAGQARRAKGEAMSPFALAFPKEALHRLGARPAIYGLSSDTRPPAGDDGCLRLLPEDALPLIEQYRYVSHFYGQKKTVDWTHEREWRWPYRGKIESADVDHDMEGVPPADWRDIPGLNFYEEGILGIGVIVETEGQANKVISDMLTLVDRGDAIDRTFSFVLVRSRLPSTIKLRDSNHLAVQIEKAKVNLKPHFAMPISRSRAYTEEFAELVAQVEASAGAVKYHTHDMRGGCWLWLQDNTARLTRALVNTGRATVTQNGRYLASLDEFSDSRSRQEREKMTARLAELVERKFQTPSCCFSVPGSDDPEAVVFHSDVAEGDLDFFNCSWDY
jgi:hypothetical protein